MKAFAYDRLARVVGQRSRRSALRTALGGATVAATGVLAATERGASKDQCKKKLRKVKQRLEECEACTPKAIGEACAAAEECCGATTGLSCARSSEGSETPVCCGTAGVECIGLGDDACCAGFFCSPDNVCVVQTP